MPCIKCENNGNLSIFQQLFFAFIHPSSKPQSSLLHICTIIFLFYFFSFSSFVGNSGWIEFSRTYAAPIGFSRLYCECYHARKWRKSLCKLRQQKSRWCSRLLKQHCLATMRYLHKAVIHTGSYSLLLDWQFRRMEMCDDDFEELCLRILTNLCKDWRLGCTIIIRY